MASNLCSNTFECASSLTYILPINEKTLYLIYKSILGWTSFPIYVLDHYNKTNYILLYKCILWKKLLFIRLNGCRKLGLTCLAGRAFFSMYFHTATPLLLFIYGPILVGAKCSELEFKYLTELTESSFKITLSLCKMQLHFAH